MWIHGIQTENSPGYRCAIPCQSDNGNRVHLQGICKASEVWKRGFVFGISRYMSAVAQPDEEPPYPVRTAFQICPGNSADSALAQHVEAYVKAHPASSNGPMTAVLVRALFDLCRAKISKIKTANPEPKGNCVHTKFLRAATETATRAPHILRLDGLDGCYSSGVNNWTAPSRNAPRVVRRDGCALNAWQQRQALSPVQQRAQAPRRCRPARRNHPATSAGRQRR